MRRALDHEMLKEIRIRAVERVQAGVQRHPWMICMLLLPPDIHYASAYLTALCIVTYDRLNIVRFGNAHCRLYHAHPAGQQARL